jgi:hypothetical protein
MSSLVYRVISGRYDICENQLYENLFKKTVESHHFLHLAVSPRMAASINPSNTSDLLLYRF